MIQRAGEEVMENDDENLVAKHEENKTDMISGLSKKINRGVTLCYMDIWSNVE